MINGNASGLEASTLTGFVGPRGAVSSQGIGGSAFGKS